MDAPEVSKGNTLYLPVNVPERYFILVMGMPRWVTEKLRAAQLKCRCGCG